MNKLAKEIKSYLKLKPFFITVSVFALVLIGSAFFVVNESWAYEPPLCNGVPGGEYNRNFAWVDPLSGIVGTLVDVYACGCGLDGGTNDYYLLPAGCTIIDPTMPPACAIEGNDWDAGNCLAGSQTRTYDLIRFDLADAEVGEYDISLWYRVWTPKGLGGWQNIIYSKKYSVFSPSIVGWGWFGASTGTSTWASPGWMSLSCLNTYDDAPDGTCYDPDTNPSGVDYGLEMSYDGDLRLYLIKGSAWLGEYADSTPNPADDAATGWVTFDPVEYPITTPKWPFLSGTHAGTTYDGPAVFDEATGQVDGWARINELKSYGEESSCTDFDRSWPVYGDHELISGDTAEDPKITQSEDGVYHAVWENTNSGQIYYSQRVDGAWSVPSGISVGAGTLDNASPDIVVDNAGTIHVSFTASTQTELIYVNCEYGPSTDCTDPNNWVDYTVSNPGDLTEVKSNQAIAAAGDNISIAFEGEDTDNGNIDVYLYQSDNRGSSWSGFTQVSVNSNGKAFSPEISRDYGNNIHVIWLDDRNDTGLKQVYYRYKPSGEAFADEEYLSDSLAGVDLIEPDITVAADNIPHVVFSASNRIYYRKNSIAGKWQDLQAVAVGGTLRYPSISVGSDYTIHVIYQDGTGTNNSLMHTESPDGSEGSWLVAPRTVANMFIEEMTKPSALADRYSGSVNVIYRENISEDINYTVSSELYGQNCNVLQDNLDPPVWGLDWGWVSLRGGHVETDEIGSSTPYYGPMGSCYDCDETAKTCMICEIDYEYYDIPGYTKNSPDVYACNLCSGCSVCDNDTERFCENNNHLTDCGSGATACILKKVCRRTGRDCTLDASVCNTFPGAVNECTYACTQCNECNLWGLSIEGPLSTTGRFHGHGWSAGGTVLIDSDYPTGSYDSGQIEIEQNIPNDYCPGACECTTTAECVTWGWERETPENANVTCSNTDQLGILYPGINSANINGFGTCKVQGSQYFSKAIPVTDSGNYFVSLATINTDDAVAESVSIKVLDENDNLLYTLQLNDNYSPAIPEVVSCTFPTQVYLESGYKFQFENTTDIRTELDSFRITSLPVYEYNCADLDPGDPTTYLTETYVDEVGLGFTDFSSVSLITPWLQTRYGDVFARLDIGPGGSAPGSGFYNSSYLIETAPGGQIQGWKVPEDYVDEYIREGLGSEIFLPDPAAGYKNVLGRIDYDGITKSEGNEYSDRVVEINNDLYPGLCEPLGDQNVDWTEIDNEFVFDVGGQEWLKNGIYHIGTEDSYCSLTIDSDVIFGNGPNPTTDNGSGLFIIEGDLIVNNNITYADPSFGELEVASQIASAGWIVKGDVIVDGSVENMAGTYAVIGCEAGGNCPAAGDHDGLFSSGNTGLQLKVEGVVLAKSYLLERTYAASDEGAEVFDNTGRLQANPPPGMVDISLNTPVISTVRPTF